MSKTAPTCPRAVRTSALTFALIAGTTASADTLTWEGSLSDLWHTQIAGETNWSNDMLPTLNDDVVIDAGPGVRILLMPAQAGTLNVSTSLTTNRGLTVAGLADINDFTMDIPSTSDGQTVRFGALITRGSSVWRDAVVADTPIWTNQGLLTIGSAGNNVLDNSFLRNASSVLQESSLRLRFGGRVVNEGIWTIASPGASILSSGPTSYFEQSGTGSLIIDMPGASPTAVIDRLALGGAGDRVFVNRGTLLLNALSGAGGAGLAEFRPTIGANGAIEFSTATGTQTIGAIELTGAGDARVMGGGIVELASSSTNSLTGSFSVESSTLRTVALTNSPGATFRVTDGAIETQVGTRVRNEGAMFLERAHLSGGIQNLPGGTLTLRGSNTFEFLPSLESGITSTGSFVLEGATYANAPGSDPGALSLNIFGSEASLTVRADGASTAGSTIRTRSRIATQNVRIEETFLAIDGVAEGINGSWVIEEDAALLVLDNGTLVNDENPFALTGGGRASVSSGGFLAYFGDSNEIDLAQGFALQGTIDVRLGGSLTNRGPFAWQGGEIDLASPGFDGATFRNTGSAQITTTSRLTGGTFNNLGTLDVDGILLLQDNATLLNNADLGLSSSINALGGGEVLNFGTITVRDSGNSMSADFFNGADGTLRLENNTALTISGNVENVIEETLVDGTWVIGAGALLDTINTGPIRAIGGLTSLTLLGGQWPQLVFERNEGFFQLGDEETSPSLAIPRDITNDESGRFSTVLNDLDEILIGSGNEIDPFGFRNGLFITGNTFTNEGELLPGGEGDVGYFALSGDLSLSDSSVTSIELGEGDSSGLFADRLVIDGDAAIDGELAITLLDGLVPDESDRFEILLASGSLTGAFANIDEDGRVATSDGLASFLLEEDAGTLSLTGYQAIPAPGTIGLVALGGVVGLRRRGV